MQTTSTDLISEQHEECETESKQEQRETEDEELDEGDEDLSHHDNVEPHRRQPPQEQDQVNPRTKHAHGAHFPLPFLRRKELNFSMTIYQNLESQTYVSVILI